MRTTAVATSPLPPVERTISVSWDPAFAFNRFTADVMSWWPYSTHSIGGPCVKRVVFEQRVGGKFFEEHEDGRRFQWGEVLEWESPRRVKFTFHPSRAPATAQTVEVRFDPEGTGTRLTLTATNWENWGKGAARARKGYSVGWEYVLNVWAGRRTRKMAMMDVMQAVIGRIQLLWHRGRTGLINSAEGEIPART